CCLTVFLILPSLATLGLSLSEGSYVAYIGQKRLYLTAMPPQFLVVFSLTPPQMGLSCCLTMATIVPKTIRGHRYYYLVQTAWVNGRSRYVKQLYLGKAEDIGKLFEEATAPVPTQGLPFEFGGTAALYSVAQQLQLAEIIDRHVPKRNQGLSVGQYALLAILNRCLAPTSKTQLAHWYAGTVLYRLLPADPAQLRSQRFFDIPPDALEFRDVLKTLRQRYAEVFPQPHNIPLVFDKGNNSMGKLRLLDNSPYHSVGSLVPTQHENLLDSPRRPFDPLQG